MARLIVILVVAVFGFSSCSSSCGANKWRCRRFVEAPKAQTIPDVPQFKEA